MFELKHWEKQSMSEIWGHKIIEKFFWSPSEIAKQRQHEN